MKMQSFVLPLAALALASGPVLAQGYPNQPVKAAYKKVVDQSRLKLD